MRWPAVSLSERTSNLEKGCKGEKVSLFPLLSVRPSGRNEIEGSELSERERERTRLGEDEKRAISLPIPVLSRAGSSPPSSPPSSSRSSVISERRRGCVVH